MILGTAAYMAPEQARGKPVDKRADIWAFGVVLFELLSGTQLFAGETMSDTLAAVLTREPAYGPAQLSPDGRWLAYRSDASGTYEIYVQSFTAEGQAGSERVRISMNGGSQPRFRPDGQELFYLADDGRLMTVAIAARGAAFEHGEPKALFKTRTLPRSVEVQFEYDVTRDGQRFLMGTILDGPHATPPPPTIVLNWMAELKK